MPADWLSLVKEARARGSWAETMAILEAEAAIRPDDAEVQYEIACTHESLGKERDAVPAYERAILLGLPQEQMPEAYLGLASTYRTLGEYKKAKLVFEKAIGLYPSYRALEAFYSLCLLNLNEADRAAEILIRHLAETSDDPSIRAYRRALLFYRDKLNQTFE